jgi:hypothetical protein
VGTPSGTRTNCDGGLRFTHGDEFLTFESPPDWGLPTLRIRPENRTDSFAAELPLRVVFQTDGQGRVTGLLLFPPRGQNALRAEKRAPG